MPERKRAARPLTPMIAIRHGSIATAVLVLMTAVLSLPAFAVHVPFEDSLEGSNFEIDNSANLSVDNGAHNEDSEDWGSVSQVHQGDSGTGQSDTSFGGGVHENTVCPEPRTGSIPKNKSDLTGFGLYEEAKDTGDDFVHMYWTRVQEPTGTTNMDFEFNQHDLVDDPDDPNDMCNGLPARQPGDMLIEYQIAAGAVDADISVRFWSGSQWGAPTDLDQNDNAAGTINTAAITSGELGSLSPRTFGEASINLSGIFGASGCRTFGSAYLKSRSSNEFNSALKDFIAPIGVEISNCGGLRINKTDGTDAMEGVRFTLYTDDDDEEEPPADAGDVQTTYTCVTDEAGTCTINNVLAGDYWVVEENLPEDHNPDEDLPDQITVSSSGPTLTLDYENLPKTGSYMIEKVDENGDRLDGAAFEISGGGLSAAVEMTDVETGLFCADGLTFDDDYVISETTTPDGYSSIADITGVSVATESTCDDKIDAIDTETDDAKNDSFDERVTNDPEPGSIVVEKVDDAGNPHGGVELTLFSDDGDLVYEPTVDDDALGDPVTTAGPPEDEDDPDEGTARFSDVPLGDYCVVVTGEVDGYSPRLYDDDDPAQTEAGARCVTVGLGGGEDTGAVIPVELVDERLHKVITVVCHHGTDTLAPSDVTRDGSDDYTTLSSSEALQRGESFESKLCALTGFADVDHGDLDITVDVGSDAHTP